MQARSRLLAIILIGLLALLASGTAAQSERNAAGLVVRHGDGSFVYTYVEFDQPSISGEELLLRAGLDVTMAPYGGLGAGVCSIDDEGCPADDCFCESYSSPAYYWQYFAYENGGWMAQPLGPSSREVSDGDIDGWSWTDGDHGLPAVTIDQIARIAGVVPEPTETPTPQPAPTATSLPSPTPTSSPTATVTPEPEPVEPTSTEPSPTPTSTVAVEPTATLTPTPTEAVATPTTNSAATETATSASTELSAPSTPEPTGTPARAAVAVDPSGTATVLDTTMSESGADGLVLFGAVAGGVILVGVGALVLRRRQVA